VPEATSSTQPGVGSSRSFSSWKASGSYEPLDWLRLRATRSRDVRAGNFRELFLPRNQAIAAPGGFPGPVTNPWNSNIEEGYVSFTGGNPALRPEEADTTTFGAVFSFDRLRFSIDWFEIDMSDAITPGGLGGVSAQNLIDACFAGGVRACEFVEGWGTTDIVSVDAGSINIGQFLTRGVDLEASYNVSLASGGNLDLRFNTSPNWQATAWLTYSRDRLTTTLETRYIGSGSLNAQRFDSPPTTSRWRAATTACRPSGRSRTCSMKTRRSHRAATSIRRIRCSSTRSGVVIGLACDSRSDRSAEKGGWFRETPNGVAMRSLEFHED
jgi:outer membrane receptor protein involved in Fe transport